MCDCSILIVHVECLLCSEPRALVAGRHVSTGPDRAEKSVPEGEEWLGEVRLDAPALVVHIVVAGIVRRDVLQRVPGQSVSTVIVNGFEG